MAHPLKDYRARAHMTQGQLAGSVGVSRTTVARWESGVRQIDQDLVPKVSEITGIPSRELRPDWAETLEAAQ